ncbi:tRNA pseudouridine(55) synthase TruB [Mycoplasma corogypsi]|uniref:tRNA pseudouridine(55) synthase TruB n=1 Tax=Mycoplasma corogypsi TaxID=2106 RepID=UPI00387310A1
MFYKFHKKTGDFANQRVRKLGRKLATKKVGHTGILDPLASGLMIVATDSDTKLLSYISDKTKTYIASCKFGFYSDSYDICTETKVVKGNKITKEVLIKAIEHVKTLTEQIPPIYSAKSINGTRAYECARNNIEVELKPQKIQIFSLELLEFNEVKQEAKFLMDVSEGTYVRSVLMDIAKFCNNSCVMSELVRTKCGKIKLDNLEADGFETLDINELFDVPLIEIDESFYKALKNGNSFRYQINDGTYFIFDPTQNHIVAIGFVKDNIFQPKKVLIERL